MSKFKSSIALTEETRTALIQLQAEVRLKLVHKVSPNETNLIAIVKTLIENTSADELANKILNK